MSGSAKKSTATLICVENSKWKQNHDDYDDDDDDYDDNGYDDQENDDDDDVVDIYIMMSVCLSMCL